MDRLLREANPPTGQLASPKPQYKKPGVDEYAPVEGQHGAPFATLKDASGNIVSPATEATLEQVRALLSGVATENKLEQARALLEAISTKDFATSSKQDALNIAVEDLKSELNLVKSELEAIKANQLSGDQKVQLSGNIVRDVLGYFSLSGAGRRHFLGATVAPYPGTLQPLDIRGFKKISIYFLNGSPTTATRNGLRVAFYHTLDEQRPTNAFAIAPLYELPNVPANGSFRLLLTSDLSDLAGTPPEGLAVRYLPNLVGLAFSYDQQSSGNDGDKIILFSGVR